MQYCILDTAWGSFGFAALDQRLVTTMLPSTGRQVLAALLKRHPEAREEIDLLPDFQRQVADYFEGRPTRFTVKIELSGISPFHRKVLEACRKIPYGKTATYAELAAAAGSARAARAVGSAMARNPLPLVIPCHRVVRSGGALGGFSSPGGSGEKERLLELEAQGMGIRTIGEMPGRGGWTVSNRKLVAVS